MKRGYTDDLSYVHDAGFGGFARDAATGLLSLFGKAGIDSGLVVDLGCGSGIWAAALCDAGYDVLGVDISSGMLAIARQRAPKARFVHGSLLDVRLPGCRAVTSLGECLNYCFDATAGVRRLDALLRRVFAALDAGGLFVFDVATPGRAGKTGRRSAFAQGADWATLVDTEEDARRRTLSRHITTFRKAGKLFRRTVETHRLRLYRPDAIASSLRGVGFRVRRVRRYGDRSFPQGIAGFVARKP